MGGSSASRRRKATRRRFSPRPRSATTPPATTQELTFDSLAITTGIGYDLLRKSGWQPGSPLGQSPLDTAAPSTPPARATPLSIVVKRGRAGLGAPHTVLTDDAPAFSASAPETRERVRAIAAPAVFDPLRPTCQFDRSHVVRNLKMLRKHEMSCPANPARGGAGGADTESRGVRIGNLFGQLALTDSETDTHSDSQAAVLSDFSDESHAEETDHITDTEDNGHMSDGDAQPILAIHDYYFQSRGRFGHPL